jgi:hypothetical protein
MRCAIAASLRARHTSGRNACAYVPIKPENVVTISEREDKQRLLEDKQHERA